MPTITESEFQYIWGARSASNGDLLRFDEVRDHPENKVWTIVESGDDSDGNWYALPGIHVVNALGYVTTTKPWIQGTTQAIYFLDDVT